jgi:hemolysin III
MAPPRDAHHRVEDAVRAVKPHLRGWLHAGTFPVAVVAGIVLVVLADGTRETVATAVYATSAALLFGVSALYHRGSWSPAAELRLKRLDHSNIFLIIAGTYTPFSVILLDSHGGDVLLWLVWAAALLGIAFRVLWVGAPRWLFTPVYIAFGWVAVFYLGDILDTGGLAVVTLLAIGGVLYSLGGLVYALQRRTRHRGGSGSTRSSTR